MQLFRVQIEEPVNCLLGESPCYDDKTRILSWVDIKTGTLYKKHQGKVTSIQTGQYIGAAIPTMSGNYIGVLTTGLYLITENSIHKIYVLNEFRDFRRGNDAKCDEKGRLWFGSMPLLDADMDKGGDLYSYSQAEGCRLRVAGTKVSNGMAWSRDGRIMYYVDSGRKQVDAFDFDGAGGTLEDRRKVIDIPYGVPDGMAIDEEGMLWVALWGAGCVGRFCPITGRMIGKVTLPVSRVTSCCFGGEHGDCLYITSAGEKAVAPEGAVYVVRTGVRGVPVNRFDDRWWKL